MTKRARTDSAKADRRGDILLAGAALFASVEFEAFTMDAVAEKLALGKGTLYRYFPTREALLLGLLDQEFEGWFTELGRQITLAKPEVTLEALVLILVTSICDRPSFVRLNGSLAALLERNIPFETAFTFKHQLLERTMVIAESISNTFRTIPPANAVRLFIQLHAAVVGLHSCAFPSPIVAEVLRDDRLSVLRLDFEAELELMVRSLVHSSST